MPEHPTPPRRRRRRLLLAGGLACALAAGFALGSGSAAPVGHWRSAEGRAAYLEAYDTAFAALPEPAETHDVRTDFGVVRVYRFDGSGDLEHPLLVLPGTAAGMPVMADNIPSLLRVGDVYAMDLLGEPGRSIQDRPITDDADKAAWLDQALDGLPEERFHALGLSIGGWTATNLALHHDEHLESLTTLDPVQTYDDIPLGTVVRSIPSAFNWMPKAWRDSFNSYTAGGAPVQDDPVGRMIEAGMQNFRMAQPQPTRITPEQLGTLEVPVLAIIAGRSVMLDPEDAAGTARSALPDGRVEVFAEASHAINGEYPEEIAALVDDFTTGIEAR
ncbi:alpha/beta fold hydrolase [Brachybacterium sacelli]|uniref:Pimeloyl-ACP methyl ester carboxylesterase n=1 Tax=Brachybacterium sacelli TaxID=173364 RepID=A0ABS4X6I3_9MICO|nr:alpha/beta hydrolase [Brachybacterium sacelli]MBP2384066.1 pimeloyl-ACP methyl ester carboxylesterase [Brachybacterium sacelli]